MTSTDPKTPTGPADNDGPPTERVWQTMLRLELTSGKVHLQHSVEFPFEPHLGDIMKHTGAEAQRLLVLAKTHFGGVLRFPCEHDSLFFTLLENVDGISVDVIDPDGRMISGADIKPGHHADDDDGDDEDLPPGE